MPPIATVKAFLAKHLLSILLGIVIIFLLFMVFRGRYNPPPTPKTDQAKANSVAHKVVEKVYLKAIDSIVKQSAIEKQQLVQKNIAYEKAKAKTDQAMGALKQELTSYRSAPAGSVRECQDSCEQAVRGITGYALRLETALENERSKVDSIRTANEQAIRTKDTLLQKQSDFIVSQGTQIKFGAEAIKEQEIIIKDQGRKIRTEKTISRGTAILALAAILKGFFIK